MKSATLTDTDTAQSSLKLSGRTRRVRTVALARATRSERSRRAAPATTPATTAVQPEAPRTLDPMVDVPRPVPPLDIWKRYTKLGQGSAPEEAIVQQYLPLVKTVVGRLAMTLPMHVSTEDLYSAGLVGLLSAVRRFNTKAGVSFETYARVRIRGSIFDELRRLDWVPRSVHDKARKVEETMRRLEQSKGEVPSHSEMAQAMKLPLNDYEHLLEEIRPATFVCLDSVRSAEQEGEATQHEAVADTSQPDPASSTAKRDLARIIVNRLEHLPPMQRKVLALYYFEDLRLREIAEVFGVTESRISQIHSQAILSIRAFLRRQDTFPA